MKKLSKLNNLVKVKLGTTLKVSGGMEGGCCCSDWDDLLEGGWPHHHDEIGYLCTDDWC